MPSAAFLNARRDVLVKAPIESRQVALLQRTDAVVSWIFLPSERYSAAAFPENEAAVVDTGDEQHMDCKLLFGALFLIHSVPAVACSICM